MNITEDIVSLVVKNFPPTFLPPLQEQFDLRHPEGSIDFDSFISFMPTMSDASMDHLSLSVQMADMPENEGDNFEWRAIDFEDWL